MNFSDCSKSRFDSLERKFRSFAAILAKNRRITCIMRRVMSISFRDLNLGPNVVYYFCMKIKHMKIWKWRFQFVWGPTITIIMTAVSPEGGRNSKSSNDDSLGRAVKETHNFNVVGKTELIREGVSGRCWWTFWFQPSASLAETHSQINHCDVRF